MRPKIGEGSDAANPKISLAFQERIYLLPIPRRWPASLATRCDTPSLRSSSDDYGSWVKLRPSNWPRLGSQMSGSLHTMKYWKPEKDC
jgi:hypothetical protein